MASITDTLNGIEDPDKLEMSHAISKHIMAMPNGLKDRFKALKQLADECADIEEERESEVHQLEVMYEALYADLYRQRDEVVNGVEELNNDYVEEFNIRAQGYREDPKYAEGFKEMVVMPCELGKTASMDKGVDGFWSKAICNHPNIAPMVSEKDRAVLQYLKSITLTLHEDYGFGFDLIFVFEKNHFFLEEYLTKKFIMSRSNVIEKTSGTKINWKEHMNPTIKKVKKKRKGKKITVDVKQDSFFTFFDDIKMPTDEQMKKGDLTVVRKDLEKDQESKDQLSSVDKEDEKAEYVEEDIGERLDRDYQLGQDFKDELIPLAYEYYLNVVDHHDTESDEEDDEPGSDENDDEQSSKDSKSKKKAEKQAKIDKKKEECKQQ